MIMQEEGKKLEEERIDYEDEEFEVIEDSKNLDTEEV